MTIHMTEYVLRMRYRASSNQAILELHRIGHWPEQTDVPKDSTVVK